VAKITPLSEIVERQYEKQRAKFTMGVCAGCGGGTIIQALARALDRIRMSHDRLVIIKGIGCGAGESAALAYNWIESLHGRALAMATGLKLARPELKIVTIQGDGDAVAIGGNHFIHAARRNMDVTTIVVNNFIYGRTGGQYGPTTPEGAFATTARFGTIESPFDVCKLAEVAGATFVARTTTYHVFELIDILEKAIRHCGFSVVDVITQCPTSFGRQNPSLTGKSAPEMMKWMRDSFPRAMSDDRSKILSRGIFVDKAVPAYGDKYQKIIQIAKEAKKNA
jgi:2-oxoglutarate ferredoxin oxidoreductase subunit beta